MKRLIPWKVKSWTSTRYGPGRFYKIFRVDVDERIPLINPESAPTAMHFALKFSKRMSTTPFREQTRLIFTPQQIGVCIQYVM